LLEPRCPETGTPGPEGAQAWQHTWATRRFTIRRYHGTLLITPSKTAVRRLRERLRTELRSLRGANAAAVIARLNPIVRGWAAYYRSVVSSETYRSLDHYLWRLTYKWARHSHPNKPTRWVVTRYFGLFNKSRADRWVFGDRDSGAYLHRFSWTSIVRHQMVSGTASTDDPTLTHYWAARRRRGIPRQLDPTTLHLLQRQGDRCPRCGDPLLDADHLRHRCHCFATAIAGSWSGR
jgi:RNA-directed DNA polymerase